MKDRKKHEKQLRLKAKKDAEKAQSLGAKNERTAEDAVATKKPKGFLAKQMEELFNPKPIDFDPADQEIAQFSTQKTFTSTFEDSEKGSEDQDEYAIDDEKTSHPKSVMKSAPEQKLRLRADIALFDGKYAGKRAARKDLRDSDEEESQDDESDDKEDRQQTQTDESEDEEEDIDAENDDEGSIQDDESQGYGDGDVNQEVDDEDADYGFSNFMNSNTEALHQIEKELEEEELNATSSFHQTATKDVEKASHVRNQMALWDEFVDVRIRLQKALVIANKFPQGDMIRKLENTTTGAKVSQLTQESLNNTFSLLDSLYECRQILASGNQELPAYPKKRLREDVNVESPDVDQIWQTLHETEARFEPYMNESIDRWNRKTQIFSGDITGKKLKSMNQTILKQVEFLMADKDRLVKRTQLKRSGFRVIGKPISKSTVAQVQNEEEEYDEEIFDDTDFYSQLLKELIERKTGADSSDPVALSRQYLNMMQMKGRNRKQVDRRASKGRKIRFLVQEKLVSFMAPLNREYPPVLDDLCSNLFGKGPSASAAE